MTHESRNGIEFFPLQSAFILSNPHTMAVDGSFLFYSPYTAQTIHWRKPNTRQRCMSLCKGNHTAYERQFAICNSTSYFPSWKMLERKRNTLFDGVLNVENAGVCFCFVRSADTSMAHDMRNMPYVDSNAAAVSGFRTVCVCVFSSRFDSVWRIPCGSQP